MGVYEVGADLLLGVESILGFPIMVPGQDVEFEASIGRIGLSELHGVESFALGELKLGVHVVECFNLLDYIIFKIPKRLAFISHLEQSTVFYIFLFLTCYLIKYTIIDRDNNFFAFEVTIFIMNKLDFQP